MDAKEALIRLTREHTKGLLRAARCLPADKLDWKAAPGNRTPLDILQELAIVSRSIPQTVRDRKMQWSKEAFAKYQSEKARITDVQELLRLIEAATETIVATIRATDAVDYDKPVEMPWPGDSRVVDVLTYHMWNLNYHEGQINYILMAVGARTPFDRE